MKLENTFHPTSHRPEQKMKDILASSVLYIAHAATTRKQICQRAERACARGGWRGRSYELQSRNIVGQPGETSRRRHHCRRSPTEARDLISWAYRSCFTPHPYPSCPCPFLCPFPPCHGLCPYPSAHPAPLRLRGPSHSRHGPSGSPDSSPHHTPLLLHQRGS